MKDTIELEKILSNNLYMTIASCNKDNMPWIANLYFVYDKDFNFYWYSPKESQHSKQINDNTNVALNIFNSTAIGDDVSAIYVKAKAYEVKNIKDIAAGLLLYGKKMLDTKFVTGKKSYTEFVNSFKDFEGQSPIRMYKAIPEKMWELAPSQIYKDKYVDSRAEINFR